jgi:hypothetical protein
MVVSSKGRGARNPSEWVGQETPSRSFKSSDPFFNIQLIATWWGW